MKKIIQALIQKFHQDDIYVKKGAKKIKIKYSTIN